MVKNVIMNTKQIETGMKRANKLRLIVIEQLTQ